MTAHLTTILSELKKSPFVPYAGAKTTLHQLRYQLHSVEGRARCPTVPQLCELVMVRALLDKAVNKRTLFKCVKKFNGGADSLAIKN